MGQTLAVYFAVVVSFATIVLADYFTPLGIAVWVFYFVPATLTLLLLRPEVPLITAAISTGLVIILGLTDSNSNAADPAIAFLNRGFGVITIWIMAIVGFLFIRARVAIRNQQWILSARAGLNAVMSGEQSPEHFGENVLHYLSDYLSAKAGTLFVRDGQSFRRIATVGVSSPDAVPERIDQNDGLVGQAVKRGVTQILEDLPPDYLTIESSLGKTRPGSIAVVPIAVDNHVNAAIELAFLNRRDTDVVHLLESVSDAIGVAVRSAKYRAELQALLAETQQQAEELQVQSEELRVANEELEEQSRALQESQARLEQQQTELEQSNAQLEEQTQILQSQRDDLATARTSLEFKAREVAQASQYKSDFLANMSHELRTPLNSLLILAKLLANNPSGNLSEEQIKSANTIYSAGNDLLTLINDILDLSKIEAGRMELRLESVALHDFCHELRDGLHPLAQQKNLDLNVHLSSEVPATIDTDRQRLEQILKNLLSNAIKFTEVGSVSLDIAPAQDRIAIRVIDTGIGISPDQHDAIFDAFRQVDSAANRKYSGTGLGLSISRQLAILLGGELTLQSEVGRGSTFTLLIPKQAPLKIKHDSQTINRQDQPSPSLPPVAAPRSIASETIDEARPQPRSQTPSQFKDDRESLTSAKRALLIVEDDQTFAGVLYDLAHDLGFQCLVALTAADALATAVQYSPSAIVLDIGLPDQSGLSVLDRLKQDSRTRHIPVHIISGNDYTETALALGAVGYMLKPVTRETLADALKNLETRLVHSVRRVLVVEDDARQLESVCQLLSSGEVETVGVQSAAECLEQLKTTTFDCMVLDLTLADSSGYALLETLGQEEAYSFPPVIVYTGRDLTNEEELQLRRYSKSIIIKGAKSPERLLDEVTLFLHQVVSDLPPEQQNMIKKSRSREAALEGKRILIVEDDVRNVFALTSILEPQGVILKVARNGREALAILESSLGTDEADFDLVLMDVMMPEMDGLTATREIRKRHEWKKLPILVLTAKAMKDDQDNCLAAGANDYMAKPLDVDRLLSLVRVWIRR